MSKLQRHLVPGYYRPVLQDRNESAHRSAFTVSSDLLQIPPFFLDGEKLASSAIRRNLLGPRSNGISHTSDLS